MMQLYYIALESGICALFLTPIFLVLNKIHFHSNKSTFISFLFAVYLTSVYAVAGLPNVGYIRFEFNFNLIPFLSMFSDIKGMILNIMLFIPLGLFAFFLFPSFRRPQIVASIGLILSLCIELLQILTYRTTDINDLITNTIGAVLGYVIGLILFKIRPNTLLCRNQKIDFPMLVTVSFCTMFFFEPLIWKLIY